MPTISINNANFYYELHGQGEPVILISGYTGDHLYWTPLLADLAQHYQVLIFDNRGIGRTQDDGRKLSAELMADDVIALADALDFTKPHIIGSSMGGTIAQMVAIRHADKIGKLIVMVSSSKWRQAMLQALHSLLALRENQVADDLVIDAMLPWIFGEKFLSAETNLQSLKKLLKQNPHPQTLANQRRQFEVLTQFDSQNQLYKITAPTLIMHGKQDLVSLPYESQFLAMQIPGAKLLELDCAHGLCNELPQEVSSSVISFLKT